MYEHTATDFAETRDKLIMASFIKNLSKRLLSLLVFFILAFNLVVLPTPVYAAGLANSTWPTYGYNNKRQGVTTVSGINTPATVKWRYTSPLTSSTFGLGNPVIGIDGSIYSRDAVNTDGSKKWSPVDSRSVTTTSVGSDGTVYSHSNFSGTIGIYSINYTTGVQNWFSEHVSLPALDFYPGIGQSSPIIGSDGTIYNHGFSRVSALNSDGTKKWESSLAGQCYNYTVMAQDDNGNLYLGEDHCTKNLTSYTSAGVLRWTKTLTGAVNGERNIILVSSDNTTIYYYDSINNAFLAIASATGATSWSLSLSGVISSASNS